MSVVDGTRMRADDCLISGLTVAEAEHRYEYRHHARSEARPVSLSRSRHSRRGIGHLVASSIGDGATRAINGERSATTCRDGLATKTTTAVARASFVVRWRECHHLRSQRGVKAAIHRHLKRRTWR